MVIFSAQGPFASDQRLQRCLWTPLCLQSPAPSKPPSLKPGAIIGSRRQLVETSCFKGSGLAPPTSWKHKGGSLLKRPVKNQRLHYYLMAQLTWHTKASKRRQVSHTNRRGGQRLAPHTDIMQTNPHKPRRTGRLEEGKMRHTDIPQALERRMMIFPPSSLLSFLHLPAI
ncbi:unnamed protein product [Leuciscus chuanchicus]